MGVYNAQFDRLDLRLLDDREFVEFMKAPAFAVYLHLVRYVWRGRSPHPIERVNRLRREGLLVAAVEREVLASKLGVEPSYVSRLLKDLESQGLVRRIRTGRQSVFVLGQWEDRSFRSDGSYLVEIFYLHQRFGADGRRQIVVEDASTEVAEVDSASTSDVRRGSGVDSESRSDVRFRARSWRISWNIGASAAGCRSSARGWARGRDFGGCIRGSRGSRST